jgi:two-component system alkaline phosphatase synthesis response regulator PhoP
MSKLGTIVLADDEAFIRLAYKEGLERAGYDIEVAEDGEEALAKVKAIKPQLVMLDLMMPKMNGFDVLKMIKADNDLKHILVVILSNLSQPQDETEAIKAGAAEFLVKADYSLEQITDKVKGWMAAGDHSPGK